MVLQHYKVKPQYFEDKYGMPCEEKPEPAIMPGTGNNVDDDQQQDDKKKKQQNAHSRFFD